jgi:probable aminopeptidase NPEPL1
MNAALRFSSDPAVLAQARTLVVVGRRERLLSDAVRHALPSGLPASVWEQMVGSGEPGDDGRGTGTWLEGTTERVFVGVLPGPCSRHNAPSRAWAIPGLLASAKSAAGRLGILFALDDAEHAAASALAVARAFPTFGATGPERVVDVVLTAPGPLPDLDRAAIAADAVRRAAAWVDAPPSQLGPTALLEEARAVADRLPGAQIYTLVGPELARHGLGGLWGVGKAAREAPALVVLDHAPATASAHEHTAWVGKGILFDTGGLSLKDKSAMPGMKTDMAGAAAVLAAFEAAVRLGHPHRLTAVLCLAENAIGPDATRPDDILRLYSGKTVEINNTDAEGRVVLADGVNWVGKHRNPTRIIDLATLTGAQAIATGKRHAAIISNDETLEQRAVREGRRTGDLTFPLPFCPELFRREFRSPVADMKNSVKDRNNAQSSCAAEFIHAHLAAPVPWLHVDMAAPAHSGERGTGYGVGLLLGLAGLL